MNPCPPGGFCSALTPTGTVTGPFHPPASHLPELITQTRLEGTFQHKRMHGSHAQPLQKSGINIESAEGVYGACNLPQKVGKCFSASWQLKLNYGNQNYAQSKVPIVPVSLSPPFQATKSGSGYLVSPRQKSLTWTMSAMYHSIARTILTYGLWLSHLPSSDTGQIPQCSFYRAPETDFGGLLGCHKRDRGGNYSVHGNTLVEPNHSLCKKNFFKKK